MKNRPAAKTVTIGEGKTYTLDQYGFLDQPQQWDEDFDRWNEHFAELVSGEWNLPQGLTPKHWEVIRFLRNYYLAANHIPTVYEVCQAFHLDLDDLRELFPEGYRRGACRIAGLPFFA